MRVVQIAFSLAALLCAPMAPAEQYEFRSAFGRFAIGFPDKAPSEQQLTASKFSVTSNDTRYAVEVDRSEFVVELHDIPSVAARLLTDAFVLEQAKRGMLDDIRANELSSMALLLDRHPARRVRFEIPERAIRGDLLLLLAERRLYLVSARYPVDASPRVSFDRFIESFEFWTE